MRPMDLRTIAAVTGGALHGDGDVTVDAVVIDSRLATPGALFAAIEGDNVDGHDYANDATATLGSRPVGRSGVTVDDVTVSLGVLAHENLRLIGMPVVVGITGSQGKTSVKDLLAHLFARSGSGGPVSTVAPTGSFNNELGVPLTVLRADDTTTHLVVEMGARGIGHVAALCRIAPPTIGVVLNVGHAHLGEFGSADNIAVAKGEMVEALTVTGVAVLNADDPRVAAMAARTRARVLTFGTTGDVSLGPITLDTAGEPHFSLTYEGTSVDVHVPQVGAHHAINAAAAAATALAAGFDLVTIAARLATARASSPMRMERHVRADGLVVVDDTYNANPESMAAALHAVASIADGRGVAVLGQMLELGPDSEQAHVEVGRLAADLGFSRVVAVGEGARGIAAGAGSIAEVVPDVDVAIHTLTASLSGDEVVLVKASRDERLERVARALLRH